MKKKNCIVNIFDFILYLYSHILPGGMMDPALGGALILDGQLFFAILIFESIFMDSFWGKEFIMFCILWIPIYCLMLWRNKKNRHIYTRCSLFHHPAWIRFLIYLIVSIGPIIFLTIMGKFFGK